MATLLLCHSRQRCYCVIVGSCMATLLLRHSRQLYGDAIGRRRVVSADGRRVDVHRKAGGTQSLYTKAS